MRVVIWLVEGTWQGCVDAAAALVPPGSQVSLLHVNASDVDEVTQAATAGLLGRAVGWHRAAHRSGEAVGQAGSAILSAAAARFGRDDVELLQRSGRVEREVVNAVAEGVDVLIAARDGERTRLGPHSLGHATRFVVDHAPCAVLLVWPDEPPGIESIPPPPPPGHRPPHPPGPPRPA